MRRCQLLLSLAVEEGSIAVLNEVIDLRRNAFVLIS
jgi:hypothetical protein